MVFSVTCVIDGSTYCVCEKISSEENKMLSREGSGTQWYCRPCRGQVKTLKDENEKLKKNNENLIMENETLKSCLDRLGKKDRTGQGGYQV